ncbi:MULTISPECIES: hypothetical protein [unclassified Bradyrhizobium]|nr:MULTISPECIES: hypothetical protein [unclassified Bradyrhizobium]MCP3384037.1 hypothetical protein [Bradyrhizobium sp. CCGUVB4N]MCP3445122.1 hypothetical protein [Bradyrhizobium sp. CCGUVB14]WFU84473.1 hypothetical protein QA645_17575 [Bradyrhizobium sp. CIAT3101]
MAASARGGVKQHDIADEANDGLIVREERALSGWDEPHFEAKPSEAWM